MSEHRARLSGSSVRLDDTPFVILLAHVYVCLDKPEFGIGKSIQARRSSSLQDNRCGHHDHASGHGCPDNPHASWCTGRSEGQGWLRVPPPSFDGEAYCLTLARSAVGVAVWHQAEPPCLDGCHGRRHLRQPDVRERVAADHETRRHHSRARWPCRARPGTDEMAWRARTGRIADGCSSVASSHLQRRPVRQALRLPGLTPVRGLRASRYSRRRAPGRAAPRSGWRDGQPS